MFVSGLPQSYNEKNLSELFKEVGLKPVKTKLLFDGDGKSKCAGFVEFTSSKEANDAVKECNNMNLSDGKRLSVSIANK